MINKRSFDTQQDWYDHSSLLDRCDICKRTIPAPFKRIEKGFLVCCGCNFVFNVVNKGVDMNTKPFVWYLLHYAFHVKKFIDNIYKEYIYKVCV